MLEIFDEFDWRAIWMIINKTPEWVFGIVD